MENKTVLIAETHKEQVEFIKKALERNKINVSVINTVTNNSEDMKRAIIDSKPDIVLTNEVKNDRPATDVIKEIQSNVSKWQPIFIISSGYSLEDIEILCKTKAIHAYSSEKPMDYDELAKEIGNIANGKETKLNKHLYYTFSKENYDIAANFMEDNALQYIYEEEYKKVNHELSELHDEFENAPKKYKEKFQRFEALQVMNNLYENSFIYQYFKNKMNK